MDTKPSLVAAIALDLPVQSLFFLSSVLQFVQTIHQQFEASIRTPSPCLWSLVFMAHSPAHTEVWSRCFRLCHLCPVELKIIVIMVNLLLSHMLLIPSCAPVAFVVQTRIPCAVLQLAHWYMYAYLHSCCFMAAVSIVRLVWPLNCRFGFGFEFCLLGSFTPSCQALGMCSCSCWISKRRD